MLKKFQKLFLILTVAFMVPLMFGGCKKAPNFPNCRNDADCRVDGTGELSSSICYMGKCEECVEDTDCPGLKQCVSNRCESVCQADVDCAADKHCEDSYCVSDCVSNSECGGDRVCARGRCLAQGMVQGDSYAQMNSECSQVEKIYFDFDRYSVKPEYSESVARLARCLESNSGSVVKIEGHTDDRGTPTYNMALGERRAKAVKDYLVNKKGIAAYRIKTVSYGEQRPQLREKNEYAWQQNRRAEFIVENR